MGPLQTTMSEEDRSAAAKWVLTVIIIIGAIPGLVIEPGPISEIAALSLLAAIWGFGEEADEAIE